MLLTRFITTDPAQITTLEALSALKIRAGFTWQIQEDQDWFSVTIMDDTTIWVFCVGFKKVSSPDAIYMGQIHQDDQNRLFVSTPSCPQQLLAEKEYIGRRWPRIVPGQCTGKLVRLERWDDVVVSDFDNDGSEELSSEEEDAGNRDPWNIDIFRNEDASAPIVNCDYPQDAEDQKLMPCVDMYVVDGSEGLFLRGLVNCMKSILDACITGDDCVSGWKIEKGMLKSQSCSPTLRSISCLVEVQQH